MTKPRGATPGFAEGVRFSPAWESPPPARLGGMMRRFGVNPHPVQQRTPRRRSAHHIAAQVRNKCGTSAAFGFLGAGGRLPKARRGRMRGRIFVCNTRETSAPRGARRHPPPPSPPRARARAPHRRPFKNAKPAYKPLRIVRTGATDAQFQWDEPGP